MFRSILKKHNCEVFTSNIRACECPIDCDSSYQRSFQETGYSIRILKDRKLGSSSSNIFEKESINKTINKCLESSKHSNPLPESFSFTDTEGSTTISKNYDNAISKDMDTITSNLAEECISRASNANVHLTNGKIRIVEFEYKITNSLGIEKNEKGTYVLAMIDSKAETEKPITELSSVYTKRIHNKKEFLQWFDKRIEMTQRFKEPSKIKGGSYDMILSPSVVAPLLLDTISYWASGKSRVDGISLFEGKKDTQIANEKFSARDDPTYPNAPSTFSIDMEASPTKKTDIIKDGIFSNHFYDNRYSSYYDSKSTGNSKKATPMGPEKVYNASNFCGMNNLIVNNGTESIDSLLSDFTGLLVEGVGIPSADKETGNFGFELRNAFLIKKGDMTPVRYGIYSGKVQDLIKNVSLITKETATVSDTMAPEYNSACICPYFLLKNQIISAEK